MMRHSEATLASGENLIDPLPEQIRAQVKRILDSASFSGSPQLSRFLEYIVEETLKGREKRLKQYTIATKALGRDADFDPNTDPVVRLDAGRLRRALENYYAQAGAEDDVIVTVPKGGYVPLFQLNTDRTGAAPSSPARVQARASPHPAYDEDRLLIMKLHSFEEDEIGTRFAAGLTEQFIVEFSRYPYIAVTSSSDSIGELLAVQSAENRFVLCGSVAQADNRIRITVRLHDFSVNSIIWTEKFDVDAGANLFGLQEEVARRIAGIIADDFGLLPYRLGLEMAYRPDSTWSIRDTILSHRFLARSMTEKAYRAARDKVEYGISQVPYHSTMWAIRAHTTFYGNVLGYEQRPGWPSLVQRYAGSSLELDHQNHYALVVLAQLHLYQRNFDEVFQICRQLLERNPLAPSSQLSAGYFRALAGDWENGVNMLSEALGMLLHPPGWAYKTLFLYYYRSQRYAQALREINCYNVPDHFTPPLLRAAVLVKLGRLHEAEAAAAEVRRINPRLPQISDTYLRYLSSFDDLIEDLTRSFRQLHLL